MSVVPDSPRGAGRRAVAQTRRRGFRSRLDPQLDRRFEAAVFDWDGTAVANRAADASRARELFGSLLEAGFELAVVTGTHVGNVDSQLALRPRGPGRMILCCNRGSEIFDLAAEGPVPLERRVASDEEEALLDRAATLLVQRLAERGLAADVVSDRLNRRKIDLVALPEWADPPKARLPELVAVLEERLAAAGIGGLPEAVSLGLSCAREAGLPDPRVTSDAKYVEIGLTDKTHSARQVFAWLARRGLRPEQVLVVGDELGPLGGNPGSDALMLVPEGAGAVYVSVGPEPNGVPAGVLRLGGGPDRFLALLEDQLERRHAGELPRPVAEAGWQVVIEGSGGDEEPHRETVLALGDGRFGARGTTLDAPAGASVLAGGRYAGRGSEEELLACPAWNRIEGARGKRLRRVLDLRTGTLRHEVVGSGGDRLEAIVFPSLARPGTACLAARGSERLLAAPDPLVLPAQNGTLSRVVRHGETTLADSTNVERVVAAASERRQPGRLDRVAAYGDREPEALAALGASRDAGFERLYCEHRARWGERWDDADIRLEGDPELERAVRFSLFGLICSAGEEGETAVGARGLSGPGYRGHVFWDTDVYTLPFFCATNPKTALAMLRYRLNRLDAARAAAAACGHAGARFPWESTRSGFDVTPPFYRMPDGTVVLIRTGSHEEHITADVAWSAHCYLSWTGDVEFSREARPLFVETARYWASRIQLEGDGRGHIYAVIGPDEYHEPVDDSAYTNVMARWNLRRAVQAVLEAPGADVSEAELERWLQLADCIVDGYDPQTGVYEEFAGFHELEPLRACELAERPFEAERVVGIERTRSAQLVKQADVVLLHHLVPGEVAAGSLEANLDFYEPRTCHGSSLSPAMHALLLARAGRLELAERYLHTAARFDLENVNGTSGSSGLHIATQGGVWQAIVHGFAGIRPDGRELAIDPRLPESWRSLELSVRFRSARLRVRLTPASLTLTAERPTPVRVRGGASVLVGAEPLELPL